VRRGALGNRQRVVVATLLGAAFGFGSSATAQDGWDIETDAERGITVASVIYDGGVGIAVQCRNYQLDLAVIGLPAPVEAELSEGGHRILDTGTSAEALITSSWKAEVGSPVATSVYSARFARSLKGAEAYVVRIPAHGDRPARRMAIPLPSDSSGIDQVLTACDRRTEDPRDALPMVDWRLVPGWKIEGLDGVRPQGLGAGRNILEYSCVLTAEAHLRDCQIEFERPVNLGIGASLIRRQSLGRVRHEGEPINLDGHIFYYSVVIDIEVTTTPG